jgi:hypothetical protein
VPTIAAVAVRASHPVVLAVAHDILIFVMAPTPCGRGGPGKPRNAAKSEGKVGKKTFRVMVSVPPVVPINPVIIPVKVVLSLGVFSVKDTDPAPVSKANKNRLFKSSSGPLVLLTVRPGLLVEAEVSVVGPEYDAITDPLHKTSAPQSNVTAVAFALWENSDNARATATKGRLRQTKIFIDGLSFKQFTFAAFDTQLYKWAFYRMIAATWRKESFCLGRLQLPEASFRGKLSLMRGCIFIIG